MTKIEKPSYSRIKINDDSDGINIIVPQHPDVGIVIIAIVINFIGWFILSHAIGTLDDDLTMSIPFVILGFILFILVMFSVWGLFRLNMDKSHLTVLYELFGLTYRGKKI